MEAEKVFKSIKQVSVVVDDIEKYKKNYAKYGIGNWIDIELNPETTDNMTQNDEPTDFYATVAITNDLGSVQIELIEPQDDKSEYARFLKENGVGIHHVVMFPANPETSMAFVEEQTGGKSLLSGDPKQGVSYRYFDLIEDLGMRVEFWIRRES